MTFNNLHRFNNTLTQMIIQFNKNQSSGSNFICIDNCRGIFNPDYPDGTDVTFSAIASASSGHFDTSPVNVRTREGKKTI